MGYYQIRYNLNYLNLINYIKGDMILFSDIVNNTEKYIESKKFFCIRHDVDADLDDAVRLAKLEYNNNIQSTYFLLHGSKYFEYSNVFLRKVKRIVDFGHDIGLHNNSISEKIRTKKSIYNIINEPLVYLRKNNIPIYGTSAHGDQICYRYKFINYQMWEEYDSTANFGFEKPKVTFGQYSLKDFDLKYESYFLDFTHYLSDSGCHFRGYVVKNKKRYERYPKKKNIHKRILDHYNGKNSGFLQLLLHPSCWKYKRDISWII